MLAVYQNIHDSSTDAVVGAIAATTMIGGFIWGIWAQNKYRKRKKKWRFPEPKNADQANGKIVGGILLSILGLGIFIIGALIALTCVSCQINGSIVTYMILGITILILGVRQIIKGNRWLRKNGYRARD